MIGPMKYYPACLKFMGAHPEKYGHINMSAGDGGSVETYESSFIRYYFPLEQNKEFYITPYPKPQYKDSCKYENIR